VEYFGTVCERRTLKVYVWKSKMMVGSINDNMNELDVELNDEWLEKVECFKCYRGACF
jgi:hypothetical protein